MADIDVVPKAKSHLWVWLVLAAIIIAIVIWALTGRSDAPGQVFASPAGNGPAEVTTPAML
jgi:hypothetical protein